jgi:hypothetical protein
VTKYSFNDISFDTLVLERLSDPANSENETSHSEKIAGDRDRFLQSESER